MADLELKDLTSDYSSTSGHIASTVGDATVSSENGVADGAGNGGSGVGAVWDDKGYSIAAVEDGHAHARSGDWPGSQGGEGGYISEPTHTIQELPAKSEDLLAAGGAGAATRVAVTGVPFCCCGCVIM